MLRFPVIQQRRIFRVKKEVPLGACASAALPVVWQCPTAGSLWHHRLVAAELS